MPIGLGGVSTAGIAELIQQTYDPVFLSLRDTEATIKKLLFRETKEGNDVIRFHLDAADVNKVRGVTEAQLNTTIAIYDPVAAAARPTEFIGPLDTVTGSGNLANAAAFLTPNQHAAVEARLDLRYLTQSIMIGAVQLAAIKGGKDSFQNILTRETEMSLQDWNREIEDMLLLFHDDFDNANLTAGVLFDNLGVMLGTAHTASKYCNVDYAIHTRFKPYVNANGGTARPLSIALLQDMFNKLEGGSDVFRRNAKIDKVLCGPGQFTNYGNLLTAQRRYLASETMDGGFRALEFNGTKVISVPGFTGNKMLCVDQEMPEGGPSYEYRTLKNYECMDKSDNTVGALLFVCIHMANTLCKGRRYQGVLADLTP
jgi:hypothetical protein